MKRFSKLLRLIIFLNVYIIAAGQSVSLHINTSCSSNSIESQYGKCKTLDDCLRNVTLCFGDNHILQFEGGVHAVSVKAMMYLIQNVTDMTLTSSSEALINCSRKVSFAFMNITRLQINRLTFLECGANVTEKKLKQMNEIVRLPLDIKPQQKIGLFLVNVENLTISEVVVSRSLGYGLLAINLLGLSVIEKSAFELSNHDLLERNLDCTEPELIAQCNGGNALFIYTDKQDNSTLYEASLKIVEANISLGVNLVKNISSNIEYDPVVGNLVGGAGVSLILLQQLYPVNIVFMNSFCLENRGPTGANVYISIFSYVMGSSITVDNVMINGGNSISSLEHSSLFFLKETSKGGGLYYEYGNRYIQEKDNTPEGLPTNNTYEVTFRNLNIIDNHAFSGGGMFITLHLSPTNMFQLQHHLLIDKCTLNSNKAFYGAGMYINQLQYKQIFHNAQSIDTVFSSSISNTIIKNSRTQATEQRKVDVGIASAMFFNGIHGTLKLKALTVKDNKRCTGMLLINSEVVCDGISLINNSNVEHGGGAILIGQSFFILSPHSTFLIANNEAQDHHGGGLYIPSLQPYNFQPPCFFQVLPKSFVSQNITEIGQYNASFIFRHNIAADGLDIYGGDLENCYLLYWDIKTSSAFRHFVQYNKNPSSVTSYPRTLCFCVDGNYSCNNNNFNVSAYPGQQFIISAIPVGQMSGVTSTDSIQIYSRHKSDVHIKMYEGQKLDKQCGNLSFEFDSSSNKTNKTGMFHLLIEGELLKYYWKTVTVHVQPCPAFFSCRPKKDGNCRCECVRILKMFNIHCSERKSEIYRPPASYIGYYNSCTYAYAYCPVDRCTENKLTMNVLNFKQDEQCVNNREGLICGKCKQGYSRVFGSNKCMQCDNNSYLLLLIFFAVAGIALVWALSYFNLTVSTGMLSGIIFYANIIKVNRDIFYPSLSKNNVLTILVSWMNLDLGIETCFFDGMNELDKTLLQFTFPLYLWFLSLLAIYLSRHYRTFSKFLGKHSTQALATVLLLSFTKLLYIVTRVFSPINLKRECKDGTVDSILAWWPDATVPFFGIYHVMLMILAVIIIVFGILPYTLLLVTSPLLKRLNHLKILRWVAYLKPFLDAYEGPYNTSSQYWTGFLLIVRIGLFLAFSLNTKGVLELQLFIIMVTMIVLIPMILSGKGIYPSKWLNYNEVVAIGNLSIYTAIIQYLISLEESKGLAADVYVSYVSLSVAALQFLMVVLIQTAATIVDKCGISEKKRLKYLSILTMKHGKNGRMSGIQRLMTKDSISYDTFSNSSDAKSSTCNNLSDSPEEDMWTVSVRGFRESLLGQDSN